MSLFKNPMIAADYYKWGHLVMQPPVATFVATTWTARHFHHHPDCPNTVIFGHQYSLINMLNTWKKEFFDIDLEGVKNDFYDLVSETFHADYADAIWKKFEDLHALGHLPISVIGVPEGTLLPVGIPDHIIYCTHPNFAWLPQFLEDMWSANNWLPSTSATTAFYRRQLLKPFVEATCDDPNQLDHMCGDFSLRGHTSLEAGYISGAAHGLSFDRTATIGANVLIQEYYNTGALHMKGTPSLEHSVVEQGVAWMKQKMQTGDLTDEEKALLGKVIYENWEINLLAEMLFINYLLTKVQPTGVMTYVSDTYDYWGVVTKILPVLKETILGRKGCFSVRPDSGDPVKIICGDDEADPESPEYRGTLRLLMDIFGHTVNEKGFKELPPQVRMIYGDAITADITKKVCEYCLYNQISLANICFGIGAFTYQYVTRDTRGFAIKATDCVLNGVEIPIYKKPKTDANKKSPRGCVAVLETPHSYVMVEDLTIQDAITFPGNVMQLKVDNGKLCKQYTYEEIKQRLRDEERRMNKVEESW